MIEQAEILEHDADAPAQRRKSERFVTDRSRPNKVTKPRDGGSIMSISFRSVVLPAPECPVRKVNEPASSTKVTSRRTSGPAP